MTKPAAAFDHQQTGDNLPDQGVGGDRLLLRTVREEQIRAKLRAFARELAAARLERRRPSV